MKLDTLNYPDSWQIKPLASVVNYLKGRKPIELTDFTTEGCQPYLTAAYLRSGKPSQFVSASILDKCVLCNQSDPILIWDGSNAGDCFIGALGVLASTMVRLVPDWQLLFNGYLYFLLRDQFETLNKSTTGSTIPHVNKNVFVNLSLPLPPLP